MYSDIVLADPWLKKYVMKEKEGQTLFGSYTEIGQSIISAAMKKDYIAANPIDESEFTLSQYNTIIRKKGYKNHPTIKKWMKKTFTSLRYKSILLTSVSLFKMHCAVKNKIEQCVLNRK